MFLAAYDHVKNWFGHRGDLAIDLWMAPDVADLQYMAAMPCDDGYMCAPGARNGANVILLVSPRSSPRNADKERFSALLAHEIGHHLVADISHCTPFAMKRKETMDVPRCGWRKESAR